MELKPVLLVETIATIVISILIQDCQFSIVLHATTDIISAINNVQQSQIVMQMNIMFWQKSPKETLNNHAFLVQTPAMVVLSLTQQMLLIHQHAQIAQMDS